MKRRDYDLAVSIFGHATVADALAQRKRALAFWLAHPQDVQAAITGLAASLGSRTAARRYGERLSDDVRRAIACAWAGDLGRDVIGALGLEIEGFHDR